MPRTLKLVWEDTGQTVVTEGEPWAGMPANPGALIELYDTTGSWTRISPGRLVVDAVTPPPVDPPVDPPPVDPPPVDPPPVEPPPTQPPPGSTTIIIQGGSLPKPTSASDVQTLLNAAAGGTLVSFDPTTRVELDRPLVVQCRGNDGSLWGVNGNGAKLVWRGSPGVDMLTFLGAAATTDAFQTNRGLLIEKLTLDGQGTAGTCLVLRATYGDQGSIYKSAVRDVYTFGAKHGFMLEGAIFESFLENVHAENHLDDGMVTKHAAKYNGRNNIISNINILHPNFSRNKGAGIRCTYSTNLIFGSFVLNALGGVVAADGLRGAVLNNGENTGEALFDVQYKGYGSYIAGNEVSSDGTTVHRQFENGQWVTYGKPCLYVLSNIVHDITLAEGNHAAYYGPPPDTMKLVKP